MKFELIDPPEGFGEHTTSGPAHHTPFDQDLPGDVPPGFPEEADDALTRPVRQRMARAVDGFRSSLEQLRAHAAAKSMAEAHQQARHTDAVDTEAVFRPHRFAGNKPGTGQGGER